MSFLSYLYKYLHNILHFASCLQNLNYLLGGPLVKKFTNPCIRELLDTDINSTNVEIKMFSDLLWVMTVWLQKLTWLGLGSHNYNSKIFEKHDETVIRAERVNI